MEIQSFFKKPPKAERAFLSPYRAEELAGFYGIRIETEPLEYSDPDYDCELGPEIILDHLALPSVAPTELANTRFVPACDEKTFLPYEGSFYFLAEHNWVDLKEIRFMEASGNSVLAEYHLIVHLPIIPPNEYSLVVTALTQIDAGKDHDINVTKYVDGIGLFRQTDDDFWQCDGKYNGHNVEIELSTDSTSFEDISKYAYSVIVENAISPSAIQTEIAKGIDFLDEDEDFQKIVKSHDFRIADFVPRSFYFYQRRHYDDPEIIIVLNHPIDVGHWSLHFTGNISGVLNWTP